MGDNIGMQNFKVTLVYLSAPGTYTSKSRIVLADTRENAIRQAVSLMQIPGVASVARVDVQ